MNLRLLFVIGGLASLDTLIATPDAALARTTPVPATEPVPVVDFFRPDLMDGPKINPTGTRVAALFSKGTDNTDLVVFSFEGKPPGRIKAGQNRDISWFRWTDDQRLFFSVSQAKHYAYGLYLADVTDQMRNYPINAYDVMRVIGVPKTHPLQPVVWIVHSASDNGADGGVVQFDATTRMTMGVTMSGDGMSGVAANDGTNIATRFPSPRDGDVIRYLAGEEGELAFALTAKDGFATLHRWADKRWQKTAVDLDQIDLCAHGEKPGELLVLGPRQEGKPRAFQRLDAATGRLGEVLYQDDTYDISPWRLHFRPGDGRLLGMNCSRQKPAAIWFDPALKASQAELDRMLPGWSVVIEDMDDLGRTLLLRATADRHPGQFFAFDVEKHQLTSLGSAAPWIDPARMRPMRAVTYPSRDGHTLEAYVTVPAGISKEKPAPLVVLPHGGPWVRDTWGWDPQAQFLASRGYLVFQPNYRGSTGYGWRFPEADEWDFKKIHEDVTDGVQAFLKSDIVDRNRVAIVGGSFGAYLALCGAANEPGLYRCAVGIAGVYDWEEALAEDKGDDFFPARYGIMKRHLGDPKLQAENYAAISPMRHVDRIKIPVFIAHGRDDRVVSVAQSKRLIRELKKNHVPTEVQLEYGEGHGFQQLDNQIELYTRIEAFLATNLAAK